MEQKILITDHVVDHIVYQIFKITSSIWLKNMKH